MKIIKRILIGLVVLVVLLVGFLLLAPVIFKDQIVENVKYSLNNNLEAQIDFADVNVSFLRSFPEVSLTLEDYEVIGVDTFAGLPLATGDEARVDLGFWSVVGTSGDYRIDAVELDRPRINLVVLSPELANYLIVPESENATSAEEGGAAGNNFLVTLDHYEVNNGTFIYDDRTTETYLEVEGLNTSGNGDFTASVFDLNTYSEADALTLRQGGTTYLSSVKTVADATVNVDLDNDRYTFRENEVILNELVLVFSGSIDLEDNDDIVFDLSYQAPANDFRQLWSMIPSAYTEGFEQVQIGGSFNLQGTVNGPFNTERNLYPAFTVTTEIDGGNVQYPGRPVAINGIDASVKVNSPGSDLDQMVIDVPRFNFTLGGDPFAGSFRLATPLSDPNVDARLDGTIDLAKWASAIPLEGVSELAGRVVADITLDNVRQSVIDAGRYADVNLAGDLLVSNLVYVTDGLPPVRIAQASADFTPQFVDLKQFSASLGRSDVSASGRIDNLLAYFSPEQTMRGNMTLRSNYFDADEWIEEETETLAVSPAELDAAAANRVSEQANPDTEIFDRFDFDVDAEIQQLAYAGYRPKDLKVIGNVKPNRLELTNAAMTLEQSNFNASGTINNLFDYTFDEGILTGDLTLRSGFFSIDDFMVEDENTAATTTGTVTEESSTATTGDPAPIPIPRNIKLNIDLLADRVQYTNVTLDDVRGQLVIQDGEAVIQNGNAQLFGGSMGFSGAYDTAEPGEPGFRFAYDLRSLDFGQTFGTLNTFAALAPVGRFLDGQFSSELVMEGKLGADLSPKLSTIDAKGLLQTAEARLATIKPLQQIGNALNVEELKSNTTLRNIMTVFQVNDGQVSVEPFDFRLAGIGMQMSGTHGLDTDMDYRIRAAIPRDKINGNIVTGTALSALDKLAGQANKLGLNITPGDTLNVNIGLTGSLSSPRVAFDLLGTQESDDSGGVAGQVTDAVKQEVTELVDSAKTQLQDTVQNRIDEVRDEATERARAVQDSLSAAAAAEADRLKQQAGDKVKDALGLKKDTTGRDSLPVPDAAKDAVKDVKKELEKFNPFKRKKKGEGGK